MERYIGLDAHGTSCTFGVIGPSGRKLRNDVVETNGAALVSHLRSIPGRKHLCLEEGTQSAWLYEILSPHVEEIVVAGINESRGQKSDVLDAFRRAEELRTGTIKTPVFKAPRLYSRLRELARVHSMPVRDVVRVQARLKVMYRARGIPTPGRSVYSPSGREQWLSRLPVSSRWATEKLHETYDQLLKLKREAEQELLAEARKHLSAAARRARWHLAAGRTPPSRPCGRLRTTLRDRVSRQARADGGAAASTPGRQVRWSGGFESRTRQSRSGHGTPWAVLKSKEEGQGCARE